MVDDSQCASCHKGLSLEDIERGGFQHIGGRLYCAECVGKMRRVGPLLCPRCQSLDTPLYNGKAYVCRKCGAQVNPAAPQSTRPAERPRAKPEERPARRASPQTKCPYCAGLLPAEALKCRYCDSHLTLQARDLETIDAQLHRLRFWLGCFLTATVFLLCLVAYMLARETNGKPSPPPQAKSENPDPKLAELQKQLAELQEYKSKTERRLAARQEESGRLSDQIDRVKAAAAKAPALPRPTPPTPRPPRPKTPTVAAKKKATPPRPKAKVAPKAKPPGPSAAERAATAAYAEFAQKLVRIRADRRYGDAIAACRQFIAAHLGTREADLVKRQQKDIRSKLDQARDEGAKHFREAMAKDDFDAARRAIAELSRYEAPEIKQDIKYMAAEVRKAQAQPDRAMTAYLAQWQAPPHVARLVRQRRPNKEGDWTPRADAAQQLGRIGHRAAISGLLEALHDPEWFVVSSAIEALVAIGDPIALPYLIPLTKASHPGIYDPAANACRMLTQAPHDKYAAAWKLLDKKKVANELLEALRQPGKEDSEVTSRYQIALLEAIAHLGVKELAPAIRSAVKTSNPTVKSAVASAIKTLSGAAPAPKPQPKPVPKPKAPPKAPPKAKPTPKPAPKTKAAPAKKASS